MQCIAWVFNAEKFIEFMNAMSKTGRAWQNGGL